MTPSPSASHRSTLRSIQAPASVVMIRPHRFSPNEETAADNAFQQSEVPAATAATLAAAAYAEVSQVVGTLRSEGVRVHLFEDLGLPALTGQAGQAAAPDQRSTTPDSVFPNNWFSTHPGGHVAIYPMYSSSRRRERRQDVIEMLKAEYRVQDVIDYSGLEQDQLFLEGTGAMVLDHIARVAYTARSKRADPVLLERFSTHFNFEPLLFDTADAAGQPIYHTNVMMCVATEFALLCLEAIPDGRRAAEVCERLAESGREVIPLSLAQIGEFAGNAIELSAREGRLLALSERAFKSLDATQKSRIERSARLLPLAVPTIEKAGGSVRCMMAGIHLSPRPAA